MAETVPKSFKISEFNLSFTLKRQKRIMFGGLKEKLRVACRDTRGTTAIEYAFIISLIGIAAVGGFSTFANEMEDLYTYISQNYTDAQNN